MSQETALELSVKEIFDIVMSPEYKSDHDFEKQDDSKTRYVPEIVVSTAREAIKKRDFFTVGEYILHAFHIYRETVNRGFIAPHVKVNGAYEWPSPVKFSWGNIEAVIYGGEFVYGKVLEERPEVEIETIEEDKVITRELEIDGDRIVDEYTKIREFIPGKDNLDETLKYKIPDIHGVRTLWSDIWQNKSLDKYATPFFWILHNFAHKELSFEDARHSVIKGLDFLEQQYF